VREAVIIGVVVRAHGVHGVVRARATGPTLAGVAAGEQAIVTGRDGRTSRLMVASHAPAGDTFLLSFEGVVTREDAEVLRGATISVDISRLPDPHEPGEFYVRDLVGCSVVIGGREIGTVREVINRPANDVLDIAVPGGASELLPFTCDAVVGVDMSARRIELRVGLIDTDSTGGVDDRDSRDAG
jgi:16S rRNA processing protein RimM